MSSDCCKSNHKASSKAACPGCKKPGEHVSTTTLLHQLTTPWQHPIAENDYYFCSQIDCDVVYFSTRGHPFDCTQLRQSVGQKSTEATRTLCYCFDIRQSDLYDAKSTKKCREFVIEKTRSKACACDTRNPSGRCCLRDFPK